MKPRQTVVLYSSPEEEKTLRWAEESGVAAMAKKLNDLRCQTAGIISVGSQNYPLPESVESIAAFFRRFNVRWKIWKGGRDNAGHNSKMQ